MTYFEPAMQIRSICTCVMHVYDASAGDVCVHNPSGCVHGRTPASLHVQACQAKLDGPKEKLSIFWGLIFGAVLLGKDW